MPRRASRHAVPTQSGQFAPAQSQADRWRRCSGLCVDLGVRIRRRPPCGARISNAGSGASGAASSKSPLAKSVDYSLKRWSTFTRFLDDGRIGMTSNAAVRGVAVGRRNWTFCGSDAGGERAAAIFTPVETAKLCYVDPRAWLAGCSPALPITRRAESTSCLFRAARGGGLTEKPRRSRAAHAGLPLLVAAAFATMNELERSWWRYIRVRHMLGSSKDADAVTAALHSTTLPSQPTGPQRCRNRANNERPSRSLF